VDASVEQLVRATTQGPAQRLAPAHRSDHSTRNGIGKTASGNFNLG